MSDETAPEPRVLTSIEDVQEVLGEIRSLEEDVSEINGEMEIHLLPYQEAINAKRAEIAARYELIAVHVMRRRKSWLWHRGRTAKLSFGEDSAGQAIIKFRIIPTSVMLPKDAKPVVAELLRTRAGRKLLRFVPEVEKDAVKSASAFMRHKLKLLGVHVGEQETVTVQVNTHKPVTVRRYRFPRR
jgi:phage host-nuclease inhibitor protein Gam